jgi:hypothetical protein
VIWCSKSPPDRPHLLKVPPLPNMAALGTKPPAGELWGHTLKPHPTHRSVAICEVVIFIPSLCVHNILG